MPLVPWRTRGAGSREDEEDMISCRNFTVASLLLVALPFMSGCGVLDFEIQRDIPEQRIEGNIVSQLLDGIFENPIRMNVDIQQETEARDTGPAQSAAMRSIVLRITDTAAQGNDSDDFDFLESVTLYIESSKDGSTLPREKLAELSTVPTDATTLDIPTFEEVDLLPYANEGAIITSEATGSAPPDDVTFDGSYVIFVDVL